MPKYNAETIEKAIAESQQFKQQLHHKGKKTLPQTIISNNLKNIQVISRKDKLIMNIEINIEALTELAEYHMLDYALKYNSSDIDKMIDYAINSAIDCDNDLILNPIKEALNKQITSDYVERVLREVAEKEKETELYSKNPSAYYGIVEEKISV